MKPLLLLLDGNRNEAIGIANVGYRDTRVLAATVAEVHTVPTGAKSVLFSATADFYANFGAAAAIPAVDVTDGTASLLNPKLRGIDGAATIGLIAPTTCIVQMEFFA